MRNRILAAAAALTMLLGGAVLTAPAHAEARAAGNQVVPIAPTDTKEDLLRKAAQVTPSERQLAWQREELTGFIHFGPNTYTGRDLGLGTESPDVLQPTGLDTDQWISSFKDAGFKKVVLTAKHHDGMLLFPSQYSSYGVASSSWMDGKGDIVKSFTDSARKYGVKVGLYLSPADLHEAQPGGTFGNGSERRTSRIPAKGGSGPSFTFEVDDYNRYYMNTLHELLTRYGTVSEVWLDGYDPTHGRQPYSFKDWYRMIRTLQPSAVVFGGPDIRWVGNEDGYARASEWSVIPSEGAADPDDRRVPTHGATATDIAGDSKLTTESEHLAWFPAECDARLQPAWFWHPGQPPKSLAALESMYFGSVGRNCQLLLNVGPDQSGRFGTAEADRLREFGERIRSVFAEDLTVGATAADDAGTSHTPGNTPALVLDDNDSTAWQPTGTTGSLVVDLGGRKRFNTVALQENIQAGQRVSSFAVDTWDGSAWKQAASATTIGYKRLLRLGAVVETSKVRLRILGSRALPPAISTVGLHHDGADDNLALGTPAAQSSSTQPGGAATNAVDGDTGGDFFKGSVSHTGSDRNAWWRTDFGASVPIGRVALWNRTDCCAARLSDYWVFVSDTPFDTSLTPEQQAARPGVRSRHQTTTAGTPTTLTVGTSGRYVMVQLAGTGVLSLAEFQAFAPAHDFSVTAEQPMTSVTPGASVTSAVGTTVTKGSPQTVRLSATGLPEGATATFEPDRIQSGAGSRLTLRTSPSTPLGDYTVKVVATGAEATHSAQITLSVTGGSASR
ncbi:alpha-L-fucosidase [Streptomyces sp. NPDC014344]|uniref:alpha-L-fucosidase n=1 Tax=Streptomyces sp. NPDC014344 TaxID=3364871 RepID=UPI0036FC5A1A